MQFFRSIFLVFAMSALAACGSGSGSGGGTQSVADSGSGSNSGGGAQDGNGGSGTGSDDGSGGNGGNGGSGNGGGSTDGGSDDPCDQPAQGQAGVDDGCTDAGGNGGGGNGGGSTDGGSDDPCDQPAQGQASVDDGCTDAGGNGGGGTDDGGSTDGGSGDDGSAGGDPITFANLDCSVASSGPIAGPLDAAQTPLIDTLGGAFAAIPEVGTSATQLVVATARLLDVVDALAASGQTLFVEQDPSAGGDALDGTALALQCGAKSLADAFTGSPLASAFPVSSDTLVRQLAELTLVFQGPDSIGLNGLQDLTNRLAGIAQTLSSMASTLESFPELLPAEFGPATGALPEDAYLALVRAPADLLANLADTLNAAGALQGQQTADAIAVTLTDLLGTVARFDSTGTTFSALSDAQEQIANGLAVILTPLFDAIAQGLGSMSTDTFPDFLVSGFEGFPGGSNPLETLLGGNLPGFDSLETLLAEVPVLGDLVGMLVAAGGGSFNFSNQSAGPELLNQLLSGAGPSGFEDLLGTLQAVGSQLTAIAPAGFDLTDGGFATNGDALSALLSSIEANAGADLLNQLRDRLGGNNVPSYTPAELTDALGAVLSETEGAGSGGLLGTLIGALGDVVNGLLSALSGNPLASLVSGLVGDFSTQQPQLEVDDLATALESVVGGFADFAQ